MTTHTSTALKATLGITLAIALAAGPVALASTRPKSSPVAVTGGTIAPPTPTFRTPNPTLWPRVAPVVRRTIVAPNPTFTRRGPWPRVPSATTTPAPTLDPPVSPEPGNTTTPTAG